MWERSSSQLLLRDEAKPRGRFGFSPRTNCEIKAFKSVFPHSPEAPLSLCQGIRPSQTPVTRYQAIKNEKQKTGLLSNDTPGVLIGWRSFLGLPRRAYFVSFPCASFRPTQENATLTRLFPGYLVCRNCQWKLSTQNASRHL
jgi:hypothetical protein